MLSQGEKKAENSPHESTDEDAQGKEDLGYFSLIDNLVCMHVHKRFT